MTPQEKSTGQQAAASCGLRFSPRAQSQSTLSALVSGSSSGGPCYPLQLIDSFTEATGPRYRKISLNGMPKPDGKPQTKAETDEEREETYVDALDLSLRHDTSDIYIPLVGDAQPFAVKRSVVAEVWSSSPGIRAQDAYDRPFGHGWTSGLTANIQFSWKQPAPAPSCPSDRVEPDYTIVTDETGARFRYVSLWHDEKPYFMPVPTNENEMDNFLASLVVTNPEDSQADWIFQFTKKYGTVLTFVPTDLYQAYGSPPPPYVPTPSSYQFYRYARLSLITDRYGRTLTFNGDRSSLIPTSIVTEDGRIMTITRTIDDGLHRITQITDPLGNVVTYNYNIVSGIYLPVLITGTTPDAIPLVITQLVSVVRPEGQIIRYAYDGVEQIDNTPLDPYNPPPAFQYYFYLYNLTSIADANNNTHIFSYQIDVSHQNFSNYGSGWYTPTGLPRIIASVILPDNTASYFVSGTVPIQVYDPGTGPVVNGYRKLMVTDAAGHMRTYIFNTPQVSDTSEFVNLYIPTSGIERRFYYLIRWQQMSLIHPTGVTESFTFNPQAAMALASVVDYSGNKTSYFYEDGWNAASLFPWMPNYLTENPIFYSYYGDPTSQMDAFGNVKSFQYEDLPTILRIMTRITDEEGRVTSYGINPLNGLRTSEVISGSDGNVIKSTLFEYTDSIFAAFMTRKTVFNGTTGADLVVTYKADANGYVAEENTGGISLLGNIAAGSTAILGLPSTSRLAVGMTVIGPGIASSATIAAITSATSITLSVSATLSNIGATLTFIYPTSLSSSGNTTSGSTTVSISISTTSLVVGMGVTGAGIPSGATIATIISSSSISLSIAATATHVGTSITFAYPTLITTTKYTHDNNGNRLSVTDANNNTTFFAYDGLNRLLLVTNPDSTTRRIGYDFAGNKIFEVDENIHLTLHEYDQLNRLIKKQLLMSSALLMTGDTASGFTTISGLASTTGLLDKVVLGPGIPGGTTVISILSSSSIEVSIPAELALVGNITSGQSLITGVANTNNFRNLTAGMGVTGTGIPTGTTVTGTGPAMISHPGDIVSGVAVITLLTSTGGLIVGMGVSGTGIPPGTTIVGVSGGTTVYLSAPVTITGLGITFSFTYPAIAYKIGDTISGSTSITNIAGGTDNIIVGMAVAGPGIPTGATVASIVSAYSITISVAATADGSGVTFNFTLWTIALSALATGTSAGTTFEFSPALENRTGILLAFIAPDSGTDLITLYTYNEVNSKISETDPNGHITSYEYDTIQRLIQITDALDQVWIHDFSGANAGASAFSSSDFKPTQITDPRGFRTQFIYDALYRITSKNVEYQTSSVMTGSTTTGLGIISGLASTAGLVVGMGVSGTGIPSSAVVTAIISATSIVLSVAATTTNTGSIVFTYPAANAFSTSQTRYDNVGNAILAIDPVGNSTATSYDALNRVVKVWHADYTSTSKTYTPASLVTTETDEAGSVTTHEYDLAGRHIHIYQPDPVTGQKTADSPLTQMGYDGVGNMTSMINPLNNEWTYLYDVRNRRIEEQQPAVANAEVSGSPVQNPVIQTGYDNVGNVTSRIDPRGNETTTDYDPANRLIETTYPAVPVYGSVSVAATTLTAYDKNGNIVSVTDEDENITLNTYDALNRLTSTTTGPGLSPVSTIIVTGNVTSGSTLVSGLASTAGITVGMSIVGIGIAFGATVVTVGSSSITLSVAATASNTGISVACTSPNTNIVELFAYDPVGNRIQVFDGRSLLTGFTYDGLNRLLQTQYDLGSPLVTIVTEVHDALNKISRVEATGRVTEYSYDARNRVLDVVYVSAFMDNLRYTRDSVGNILSILHPNQLGSLRDVSYSYDKLNRQLTETSDGVIQVHTYDKASNRITTVYGGTGRSLTYAYDALNRLASITEGAIPPSDLWIVKTGAYTAVAGDKIQADTSGGAFTITLPSSANPGDTILIQDAKLGWNANNLTIDRNGLNLNGVTSNYVASLAGNKLCIVYVNSTYGWSIK